MGMSTFTVSTSLGPSRPRASRHQREQQNRLHLLMEECRFSPVEISVTAMRTACKCCPQIVLLKLVSTAVKQGLYLLSSDSKVEAPGVKQLV